MTSFQEILESITRHRANPIEGESSEVVRKIDEIEWALQALAETLRDREEQLRVMMPPKEIDKDFDEVRSAFEECAKPDQHGTA